MAIGGAIGPKFREADCHFSDRKHPGALCKKYGRDHWWAITPRTDAAALKAEIAEFLENYAFPWLGCDR